MLAEKKLLRYLGGSFALSHRKTDGAQTRCDIIQRDMLHWKINLEGATIMTEKKATLYDLVKKQSTITQQLLENDGELTPEIEAMIKKVDEELPKKVDSYATLMDKLKSEVSYLKELEKSISSKRKAVENVLKNLDTRVKQVVMEVGELAGDYYTYKPVKQGKKLVIDSNQKFDKCYLTETVVTEVNKKLIQEDLELGEVIPGAELVPVVSVRKYFKGGDK